MMVWILAFALAASLGAGLRYFSDLTLGFGWGVLLVNVLGSLLIGLMANYLDRYSPQLKMILLVAFLGSLTTFSSYSLTVIKMFESGELGRALFYSVASNGLSLVACYLGYRWSLVSGASL